MPLLGSPSPVLPSMELPYSEDGIAFRLAH
jgi:hypothetical protein